MRPKLAAPSTPDPSARSARCRPLRSGTTTQSSQSEAADSCRCKVPALCPRSTTTAWCRARAAAANSSPLDASAVAWPSSANQRLLSMCSASSSKGFVVTASARPRSRRAAKPPPSASPSSNNVERWLAARHRARAIARKEHPGLPLAPAIAITRLLTGSSLRRGSHRHAWTRYRPCRTVSGVGFCDYRGQTHCIGGINKGCRLPKYNHHNQAA